jgi:hypothetical protein
MKKSKVVETAVCDSCGKDEGYACACLHCNKDFCYECRKAKSVDYPHGVYFSGSGDGLYCKPCDQALKASGANRRHTAYLQVRALRNESERFYADFKARSEAAEAEVKRAIEKETP